MHMYIYTHMFTGILFDFIAAFSEIYHGILRTAFLPKTRIDCFFLCQKTYVYTKMTALICLKIDSVHVQK